MADRSEYKHNWYLKNKIRLNKKNRIYYYNVKKIVILEYGGKCVICGSKMHLEIDHTCGHGTLHRKEDRLAKTIYIYLRKLNYPKDSYRLLCRKCNSKEYWTKQRFFK